MFFLAYRHCILWDTQQSLKGSLGNSIQNKRFCSSHKLAKLVSHLNYLVVVVSQNKNKIYFYSYDWIECEWLKLWPNVLAICYKRKWSKITLCQSAPENTLYSWTVPWYILTIYLNIIQSRVRILTRNCFKWIMKNILFKKDSIFAIQDEKKNFISLPIRKDFVLKRMHKSEHNTFSVHIQYTYQILDIRNKSAITLHK